ncbi:hypothetical protein D3C76_1681730 [compost metagenome]
MDEKKELALEILRRYEHMEDLCEMLDSCYDLHDLGYCSAMEQNILTDMAQQSALTIWAIWNYANTGNVNYEYPFDEFAKYL